MHETYQSEKNTRRTIESQQEQQEALRKLLLNQSEKEDVSFHNSYMALMSFCQLYKESICYEATGMLPGKGTRAEQ